jgi:hypothetical protein
MTLEALSIFKSLPNNDPTLSSYLFSALWTGSLIQNKMATDNALAQSRTQQTGPGRVFRFTWRAGPGGGVGVLYKVGPGRALQRLVHVLASRNYGLIRERRWLILSLYYNSSIDNYTVFSYPIIIIKVDVKFFLSKSMSGTFAERCRRKFSKRAVNTVSQAHPQPDRPADCDKSLRREY